MSRLRLFSRYIVLDEVTMNASDTHHSPTHLDPKLLNRPDTDFARQIGTASDPL